MDNTKSKKRKTFVVFLLSLFVIIIFALETFLLDDITKVEGIKIGLYNVFIIFAIRNIKPRLGYILWIVKLVAGIVMVSSAILYPLLGGLLSITAMIWADKIYKDKIGYLGIGIIGALIYNITVYAVAAVSLSSMAVFYNLPTVLFLSVVYGALTGALAYLMSKTKLYRLENNNDSNI